MVADQHDEAIDILRREVLRWNARFSLISRSDTQARLEALIQESVAACRVLLAEILPDVTGPSSLHYLDLGSGAGFPGIIWHLLLSGAGMLELAFIDSCLVEPREKRAWFLEQTASLMGLRGLRVGVDQWGRRSSLRHERAERAEGGVTGLISMKALYLTDTEVVAGWKRYRDGVTGSGDDTLIICRFHPPLVQLDARLRKKLELPPVGDVVLAPPASSVRVIEFMSGSTPSALLVSIYPHI